MSGEIRIEYREDASVPSPCCVSVAPVREGLPVHLALAEAVRQASMGLVRHMAEEMEERARG